MLMTEHVDTYHNGGYDGDTNSDVSIYNIEPFPAPAHLKNILFLNRKALSVDPSNSAIRARPFLRTVPRLSMHLDTRAPIDV